MRKYKFTQVITSVMLALLLVGCPTAQQWFQIVEALLPIIGQTYLQFYGFASKNGVDAGDIAKVQQLTAAGQDAVKQVAALVQVYQTNSSATTLTQVNAILAQMEQAVNAFLTDAQIKNSARFNEYSAFAQAILADVQDVLSLVPVVTTVSARVSVARAPSPNAYHKAKSLKGVFEERLSKLPQS